MRFGTITSASGAAALALALSVPPATAQTQVLKERTTEIPRGGEHEARMFVAEIPPGGAGQLHTHPAPVLVYVLEGSLTFEPEGQESREYRADQAYMEPTTLRHRVRNSSNSERLRILVT